MTPGADADPGRSGRFDPVDVVVVAALLGVALLLRWPALDPSSLWLDDAWVALVGRVDSLGEVSRTIVTAPGFTVLLWAWLRGVGAAGPTGVSELLAQLPALMAGGLGIVATYVVARRLPTVGRAGATLAAAVVVAAPVHITYSTRVKPYTLDGLLAVVVAGVALWAMRGASPARPDRRPLVLALVGIGATVVSSSAALAVAGAFGALLLGAWRGDVHGGEAGVDDEGVTEQPAGGWHTWRPVLLGLGLYAVFAAAWWLVVLRRTVTDGLRGYWADHYLPPTDLGAAAEAFVSGGRDLLEALAPLPWFVTLVLLGALLLVGVRWRSPLVALWLVPVVVSFGLAVLEIAPWGGGRTDAYLVPLVALSAAAVFGAAGDESRRLRASPWIARSAAAFAGGLLVAAALTAQAEYPPEDVGPLVARVEEQADPDDAVVVYSATRLAWALYSDDPVRLVVDEAEATGFDVELGVAAELAGRGARRSDAESSESGAGAPEVIVLPPLRSEPSGYREILEPVVGEHRPLWFVASHWGSDYEPLVRTFTDLGCTAVDRIHRPGARLIRWEC